ncbi:hypothetical protein PIB30_052486 [Stylosanthes scabra]|uniref:RRM domain-containing protein n=1 Tax=Stylosanthes scabra TaxID=79078 RepID=A0ABU6SJ40_9FABA|nr:hypothetical protein [Stylosanthes scabra]
MFSVLADNLPIDATKRWLWKVFSSTGRVEDIYLSIKVRKGNPLRFAFIIFKTREEARRAIEQLDGWIVWGCRISVSESKYRRKINPKNERPDQAVNLDECSRLQTFGNSKIYLEESKALKEKLRRCVIGEALDAINVESLLQ